MSLVLHLSDLHLGQPSAQQHNVTDKFGLDSLAGSTRKDDLNRTLDALVVALRGRNRKLDALVVSGDITNGNGQDGYDEFADLVGRLEPVLGSGSVLVVPGNHDADWDVQPGEPAKFERFLGAAASAGHRALIYGVDYDDRQLDLAAIPAPSPVFEVADAVLVGISSSDYCGVTETRSSADVAWDEVLDAYLKDEMAVSDPAVVEAAKKKRGAAAAALRRLRVQDMARVNPRQLEALERHLIAHGLKQSAIDDPRVRIAVLHHPIGPVSDREEVKAFESVTNLAAVRSFLYDLGFHVVLHGHKHEAYRGWEWLLPPGTDTHADPWRLLVLGAPGEFAQGGVVCRLLDIPGNDDRSVAGAPRLRVVDVHGVRPGQDLELDLRPRSLSLFQPFVGSTNIGSPWVVRALTADAAYQQLRDLPTDPADPRPVISIVDRPESASMLPTNYPEDRDSAWLASLVDWWQHPKPEATSAFSGSDFNHGERLHRGGDAIAKAAAALPSSKAIAILVDSADAGSPDREFPALTAVQLQVRGPGDGNGTLIDIVGIYRKQDLELWWPVNMLELARMQAAAIAACERNALLAKPLVPGRLIALATIGTHEHVLPQMAGAAIDRAVDLSPGLVYRLAQLAAQPNGETPKEWRNALEDIGTLENDVVLVPSIGLDRLSDALALQSELGHGALVATVAARLSSLIGDARAAALALSPGAAGSTNVEVQKYWSGKLIQGVEAVLSALRSG